MSTILDAFDQADCLPSRGMTYKVIILTLNPLTGEALRTVYPANSMDEAQAIETATDPDNSRERIVTIVPDAMEYLRCHYPEALGRLYGPK